MSKFGSKEDLLKAIETQFSQMQSGRLSMEDLELLVEQSRELYERTLILRYKAYEEKVFGEVKEVLEPTVEQKTEEEEVPVLQEEAQAEVEIVPDLQPAEAIFDFDLFEENPIPAAKTQESELDEIPDLTDEEEDLDETSDLEVEEEEIEAIIAVEEITEVTSSAEEIQPVVIAESPEVPSEEVQNLKPEDEKLFKNILISDGSLASKLMLSKLESLIGSFGFNEKFQCAEELFKGSNEDFNQALRVLDNMESFEEAKKQLVFYIHLYKWDLDSEAAIEFIRKVERRFS